MELRASSGVGSATAAARKSAALIATARKVGCSGGPVMNTSRHKQVDHVINFKIVAVAERYELGVAFAFANQDRRVNVAVRTLCL